jgi:hypothetical protein
LAPEPVWTQGLEEKSFSLFQLNPVPATTGHKNVSSVSYSAPLGLAPLVCSDSELILKSLIFEIRGRIPWMEDQPFAESVSSEDGTYYDRQSFMPRAVLKTATSGYGRCKTLTP